MEDTVQVKLHHSFPQKLLDIHSQLKQKPKSLQWIVRPHRIEPYLSDCIPMAAHLLTLPQSEWLLCCPSNMRHTLLLQCPELIYPLLRNMCMAPSLSSFKPLFKYLLSEAFASLSKLQPHLHQHHHHCYFTYTKTHTQTHSLFPMSYFFCLGNHNKRTYYVMILWTVCINVLWYNYSM